MPESPYELSTSDLLLVQDLILWAKQFKWQGIGIAADRVRRLEILAGEIDGIVVARAAAGEMGSMAAATEVLRRKPAGSEVHRAVEQKTGTKDGKG